MYEPRDMAAAIRRLRGTRTMKQVALAVGLKPSAWSTYEHGRRRPRPEMIERLSRALGCTVAQLEEQAWEERRQRLEAERAGQEEGAAEAGSPSGRSPEAYRREIHARLHKVADELTDLFVLLKQPPTSTAS